MRLGTAGMLVAMASGLVGQAHASDSNDWFNKAVQSDLAGGEGSSRVAYEWYLRAAEAGLPEAEFNTGVMLDSGRGVAANLGLAATWYARAASRGNRRAAYNLGQLYEAGEGVPKNAELAQAWFQLSGLPAARARATSLHVDLKIDRKMSAPILLAPAAGATLKSGAGGIELVWTAQQQPEPVRYFVELRAVDPAGSQEVFSGFTDTSSLFATPADIKGDYAWRVLTVARETGDYLASGWQRFSVPPETRSDERLTERHG